MTQWGLDTLFNPAKRHMDEEKRRLQATREQIGDSSGGKRIDFESGKVTIRRAKKAGADDATEVDDTADTAGTVDAADAVETAGTDEPAEAITATPAPADAPMDDEQGAQPGSGSA